MADAPPLWHFSDRPGIERFDPRPVRVPAARPAGMAWLNGPLVWAIDDADAPLYLFPRDCPRILVWATPGTTAADRAAHGLGRQWRMAAYVETRWMDRLSQEVLWRYDLPPHGFTPVHDVGMWVCRAPVIPTRIAPVSDLPNALRAAGVRLRALPRLTDLRTQWSTSLHVSGLRLRNAAGWAG